MIGLHAAGITDVGRQREGNEDSLHVGDSVFAVADGMGGHRAGEIASALALEPIAALDGRVFGDVDEARAALADAVVEANRNVVDAAAHDSELSGMGTTLTAALFEGRRLHVAHVGDSRAYLLRAGEVLQLTRDHTFVQQLLDDGRITEDEVATHPHRSVITRAIGVSTEVEVDLQTIDLQHDDVLLLCSDGLSGVVREGDIAAMLRSQRAPGETVVSLVEAANEAGGPDNITAVLLTVVNTRDDVAPYRAPGDGQPGSPEDEPTTGHDIVTGGTVDEHATSPTARVAADAAPPMPPPAGEPSGAPALPDAARPAGRDTVGHDHEGGADGVAPDGAPRDGAGGAGTASAAAAAAATIDPDADATPDMAPPAEGATPSTGRGSGALVIRPDGDAGTMRPLPGPGPDESLVVEPKVRRRRIASVVVAVAIVIGIFVGGSRWLLSRSYFVGLDGDAVAIYKGIPATLGPLELSWVFEETGLTADQLPRAQVEQLQDDPAAANLTDARAIVNRYREAAEALADDDTADDESGDDSASDADDPTDDPTTGASDDPTTTDGSSSGDSAGGTTP